MGGADGAGVRVTTFAPSVLYTTVLPPRRVAPAARDEYAWAAPPLIDTDPVRRRRDPHACPPDTLGKTGQDRGSGVPV